MIATYNNPLTSNLANISFYSDSAQVSHGGP